MKMMFVLTIFLLFFRTIQSQIKPCLDKLNSDPDVDVKFFAQEALGGKSNVLCRFENAARVTHFSVSAESVVYQLDINNSFHSICYLFW